MTREPGPGRTVPTLFLMKSGAELSEDQDRKYRYALWRIWDENKPYVLFIGLNPSTADETKDDPTVRRCIGFTQSWKKYGGVYLANLFAYRATNPRELEVVADPIGPGNDECVDRYRVRRGQVEELAARACRWR